MSTEFYVNLGGDAYTYGKEPEDSFDAEVHRLGEREEVHFFFKGTRHHVGTFKTSLEIGRWLAHALLAAAEGAPDVRASEIQVRDNAILKRLTRAEMDKT